MFRVGHEGRLLRERDDSRGFLERCRTENLFLTQLASPDNAFHLHALVSQLLRATLGLEDPDRLRRLRLRASFVFEQSGDITTALTHAADAEEATRVGELVSAYAGDFAHQGRFEEIRSWMSLLRRDAPTRNPEVEVGLAMTLAISGRTTEALEQVDQIETENVSPCVRYAGMQARGVALMLGGRLDELADVASMLDADMPEGCDALLPFEPVRVAAHWAGVSALITGDLAAARTALERAAAHEPGPDVHYVDAAGFLARVAHAGGNLDEALRHANECLARNEEMGGGETSVLTCAYVALADVAWERDELDRAVAMLTAARRSVRPVLWEAILVQLSASRLLASRGELAEAREQLIECGQTYLLPETSPSLRAVLCETAADLALRAQDIDAARAGERSFAECSSRPLAPDLQLRLAAAIDTGDIDAAIDTALTTKQPLPGRIDTLLAAADAVGRNRDERRCVELVARATRLAERNGLVRRFRDAGEVVRAALGTLRKDWPTLVDTPVASQFFLDTLAKPEPAVTPDSRRRRLQNDRLVEPLTPRELQVLELLIAGRSYTEIGLELFVSRNTVKSHASHIYTKLAVSGRAEAAEAARFLDLL